MADHVNKAVNNAPPKLPKNRRLGKNKKKAWRAANVQDIQDFLDDERRQLLTGGLVAEKSDDSLFVLDTKAVKAKEQETSGPVSKRSKKDKALKCLANLQPDPHSKVVRTPDDESFKKGKRSQSVAARRQARSTSSFRLEAKAQSKKAESEREKRIAKKRKLPTVESDIWADSDTGSSITVKPPKRYRKKPSALSATVVPHPGASVNPAADDHQALLLSARNKEVGKYKAEKKIFNAVDAKFLTREQQRANEVEHLVEMSAGLVQDSEDEDSDTSLDEYFTINPPVRREDRKTRKQRRVEHVTEFQKNEKKSMSAIKQRENMVLRLPTLKSEINKKEKVLEKRRQKKKVLKEQSQFKTKRLGKVKYQEPDEAVKLSSELVASFREVVPEGHVIQDVYKSLQRRNIIEPRIRQKNKRKYKPKVFEKKGHKEVTL